MSSLKNKPVSILNNEKKQSISISQTDDKPLLIEDLKWTENEAKETYYRLKHFEDDWNVAGMESYDQL
jgi:hypothetical protein